MSSISIIKTNGEIVEISSEDPLTLKELKELCGENDSGDPVLAQLVKLVDALEKQGGAKPPVVNVSPTPVTISPAQVHVPEAKHEIHVTAAPPQIKVAPSEVRVEAPAGKAEPVAWNVSVTERDRDGRVKSLQFVPWTGTKPRT